MVKGIKIGAMAITEADSGSDAYSMLNQFIYYPFIYPVITNIDGCVFSNMEKVPDVLTKQLFRPVRFSQALKKLAKFGIELTIEMGPKILLTNFISSSYGIQKGLCYGVAKDRVALAEMIHNDINFEKDVPDFIGQSLAILASCENRENSHDSEIIQICSKIREWYLAFKESKWKKNKDIYEDIFDELIRALFLKGFSSQEIQSITKGLLDMTNMQYQLIDRWKNITEAERRD